MAIRRPAIWNAIPILALIVAATWLLSRRSNGTRSVSGTVEVDEAHVASRYGGRVEKIDAQEGDTLTNGQPIVELDAAELRARRDYTAALLDEMVHGPRPAEIDAAKHDWESLNAQLDFAMAEAKRQRELYRQNVNSPTDLDDAVSREHSLQESADAAKRRYDLLAEGTRPERIAQTRAQLAEIDAQLAEMRIAAPDICVMETLSVKLGDVLGANHEVATLLYPQHLWVRVYVPEPWLGLIQLGQTVQVHTDSSGEEFTGAVEQINRAAEFTPRNVQTVEDRVRQVFGVKVRLPSDTGKLRAGMSADVSFPNVPPIPK
ncbi:MAG TPA: efflux RND transporter periplasmic adaptor subunit [Verrucomicrobiae bacterium]|nr:efflux RND transporter periplasmic adaptor subunit [Verrucomicrobiae bacterium]